jgi:hypothetical protein
MSSVWSSAASSSPIRSAANAAVMRPLASLVYQSQSVAPMSEPDLQRLVASSQARNRKEGVTGLLIYDQGRFLQWLEGPTAGVGRVWQSISEDPRHTDVSVLGQSTAPVRFFGANAMALGKRRGDGEEATKRRGEVGLPAELIETLRESPRTAPWVLARLAGLEQSAAEAALRHAQPVGERLNAGRLSLQAIIDGVIVPRLLAKHEGPLLAPLIIDARAGELARLLLTADPEAAFALINVQRADGRSIAQLCAGLFEPAARALGDLWLSDDCSQFDVTQGMGHLQRALRRISIETSSADVRPLPWALPHAVLVAPSPRETHMLGSVIASEMFWRAGWDVQCEFPDTDEALGQLVHDRWFDVLDLSLSGAFTREHSLPAMAASIRAAHAESLNPALTVIVDGRVFHERPQAFNEVGADGSTASAQDAAPTALHLARAGAGRDRTPPGTP